MEEDDGEQRSRFACKQFAMERRQEKSLYWKEWPIDKLEQCCLMGWSDGGHRRKGISGGGLIIKIWEEGSMQPEVIAARASFTAMKMKIVTQQNVRHVVK